MKFRRFFRAAAIGVTDFMIRVSAIRAAEQRETYDENGVPASESLTK
jgi:hypothetical protein